MSLGDTRQARRVSFSDTRFCSCSLVRHTWTRTDGNETMKNKHSHHREWQRKCGCRRPRQEREACTSCPLRQVRIFGISFWVFACCPLGRLARLSVAFVCRLARLSVLGRLARLSVSVSTTVLPVSESVFMGICDQCDQCDQCVKLALCLGATDSMHGNLRMFACLLLPMFAFANIFLHCVTVGVYARM